MKSPCKDCENRRVGCHSDCVHYKAYEYEIKEVRHLRNQYAMTHSPPSVVMRSSRKRELAKKKGVVL